MILSASRRTDIPNYYAEWFLNRMREGFFYVRNPYNPHQVSRIAVSPDVVDCIVFWTKNPADMLGRLDALRDYVYYFQFTLTGYQKDMEPNLPDKSRELIPVFQRLSEKIGKEKVIWRYDPVLWSTAYTVDDHIHMFSRIADRLCGYTQKVVISFVDWYAKMNRNAAGLGIREMTMEEIGRLAGEMAQISQSHHMEIETCAEQIDVRRFGIGHGSCIDRKLIEKLTGCRLAGKKDKNQREACSCLESVDIGTYHTCPNGCRYCYANFSDVKVRESRERYRADSPLLCSFVGEEDKITDRKVCSLKENQLAFRFP